MKTNIYSLAILFILGIMSCNEVDTNNANPKAEARDRDCGYCSEVKVEVNYSPVENGCCKAEVIIKSTTGLKDCHQMIFINGDFLQNITEEITNLKYNVCGGEPTVVRVMGFDDVTQDFTMTCFEQKLNCSTCCDNITYEAFSCGSAADKACCSYTYKFFNNSTCAMNLYEASGVPVLALPANSYAYKNLEACANDPASLKYYIGKSVSEPCKEIALNTNCQTTCNCGLSTILVKQSKTTLKGCCKFSVTAYNKSNCTQFLFEEGGSIIATLPSGGKYSTTIIECISRKLYLGSNPDAGACGVCANVKLTCTK